MIRKLAAVIAAMNARASVLRWKTDNRNPVDQRLADLERGQILLNATIQEFMTETERVMEELSRLMRETQERAASQAKSRKSAGRVDAKYHAVQLSRQGKRVDEIASQLGIPTGEVQLILNLHRDTAKAAVAK